MFIPVIVRRNEPPEPRWELSIPVLPCRAYSRHSLEDAISVLEVEIEDYFREEMTRIENQLGPLRSSVLAVNFCKPDPNTIAVIKILKNEIECMKTEARIVVQRFDEATKSTYDENKWADFVQNGKIDPLAEIRWGR